MAVDFTSTPATKTCAFLDTAAAAGFIQARNRNLLRVAANAADALAMIDSLHRQNSILA